jgi:hypothetical protein
MSGISNNIKRLQDCLQFHFSMLFLDFYFDLDFLIVELFKLIGMIMYCYDSYYYTKYRLVGVHMTTD